MNNISRIVVYPVKSLPGVAVASVVVGPSGALHQDRAFAIVDERGAFVNGKREPRIHALGARIAIEGDVTIVSLSATAHAPSFRLEPGASSAAANELASLLSRMFGYRVRIAYDDTMGFPDDTESPGPTIVSEATLDLVASWFPNMARDEARDRFRANIEIANCCAFWEDCLYGEAGAQRPFRLGTTAFFGINPCQRCVVPSRHPDTGEVMPGFQRRFVERRRETLPPWAEPSRFNIYYRLAVNTRIADNAEGMRISVGDPVALL